MNPESVLTTITGLVAGAAVAWWRRGVYDRKLIHFNVNLDKWAHYKESERQAPGAVVDMRMAHAREGDR
jgi:hypothetical protein